MRRLYYLSLLSLLVLTGFSPVRVAAEIQTLDVPGGQMHLLIEDKSFAVGQEAVRDWVERSVLIVSRYYGEFPIAESHVAIRGRPGRGVFHGRALGYAGAVINVSVGLDSTPANLDDDWVLIHELIHFAFPTMPRRHHWIEEGLSVYVETIARANAGALSPERAWAEFVGGMPKGLPKAGDRGLDYTPTWGRTYWGGALFCLLADIRIREQTDNEYSLRDGLRAIVAAGYNITEDSQLRPVLEIADRATGVPVMTELYDEMRDQPYPDELDSLWRSLGVERTDDEILFDDRAPLTEIRKAITGPARP